MKQTENTTSNQPFENQIKNETIVTKMGAEAATTTTTTTTAVVDDANTMQQSSNESIIEVTKDPGTSDSPSIKYVFERKPTMEQEVSRF